MPRPERGVGAFPYTPWADLAFQCREERQPHVSGCPGGRVTGDGSGGCGLGGCPCPAGRARCAVRARLRRGGLWCSPPAKRRRHPRARKGFNILSLRFLQVSALRLATVPAREGAARAQPTSQGAGKSLAPRWSQIGKEKRNHSIAITQLLSNFAGWLWVALKVSGHSQIGKPSDDE